MATAGPASPTTVRSVRPTGPSFWTRHRGAVAGVLVSLVIAIGLTTGPPCWFKYVGLASAADTSGVVAFQGGCAPFSVYAQDRWKPYGAAVRTAPAVTAKQVAGKDPNQSIPVDGWVHGGVAYPTNTAPWNNDVWFHMADGGGWISFAGVRASPVSEDPTGKSSDGGPPVTLEPGCQGSAQ